MTHLFLSLCMLSSLSIFADPHIVRHEMVSSQSDSTEDGNSWGNQIPRIVRTKNGIYTTVMYPWRGQVKKKWKLYKRNETGKWNDIQTGPGGREPIALTAAPNGELYLTGQDAGRTTFWKFSPNATFEGSEIVPGISKVDWAYNSAGISSDGTLCVLTTNGNSPAYFSWSCRDPRSEKWKHQKTDMKYRHAYTYVFPGNHKNLTLVSSRDVMWPVLGINSAPASFGQFSFSAFGMWNSANYETISPTINFYADDKYDGNNYEPFLYADDVYMDRQQRIHVLYRRGGPTLLGVLSVRHLILDTQGEILHHAILPQEVGTFGRIFESQTKGFYALSVTGYLLHLGQDGTKQGKATQLDLRGKPVSSQMYLALPRGGNPVEDFIDGVYPSDERKSWIYFRLEL